MKFLGIDWGKKYIGLAIGCDSLYIATPIKFSIRKWNVLKQELQKVIQQYSVTAIILGLPTISGKKTKACNEIYSVQDLLKTTFNLPIYLQEEMCTSIYADLIVKKHNHSYAAAIILQDYLDNLNTN